MTYVDLSLLIGVVCRYIKPVLSCSGSCSFGTAGAIISVRHCFQFMIGYFSVVSMVFLPLPSSKVRKSFP